MSYDDEAPSFSWTEEDLAHLVAGARVLAHKDALATEVIVIDVKAGTPSFDLLYGTGHDGRACIVSTRHCDPNTIRQPEQHEKLQSSTIERMDGGAKVERLAHARAAAEKARLVAGAPPLRSGLRDRIDERPPARRPPRPKRLAEMLTGPVQLAMAEMVREGWKRDEVERAVERFFRDEEGQLRALPEQLAVDLLRASSGAARHVGEGLEPMAERAARLLWRR